MTRLSDVKQEISEGRNLSKNAAWLIKTVEHQNHVIDHFQHKVSFNNYMNLSKEKLDLELELQQVQEQLDFYKQAYEGLKRAL